MQFQRSQAKLQPIMETPSLPSNSSVQHLVWISCTPSRCPARNECSASRTPTIQTRREEYKHRMWHTERFITGRSRHSRARKSCKVDEWKRYFGIGQNSSLSQANTAVIICWVKTIASLHACMHSVLACVLSISSSHAVEIMIIF